MVAPEHALLGALASDAQRSAVDAYVAAAAAKSDLERTELQKRKTGVFTGAAPLLSTFSLRAAPQRILGEPDRLEFL